MGQIESVNDQGFGLLGGEPDQLFTAPDKLAGSVINALHGETPHIVIDHHQGAGSIFQNPVPLSGEVPSWSSGITIRRLGS